MEKLHEIAPITSLQPPYSLIKRDVEESLLPWCTKLGVGTIVYSPMASGLLTGAMTRVRLATMDRDDWRLKNSEFREPKLTQNLELVDRLRAVGERHGRAPGEVAIAWTLHNSDVTAAIVGARHPSQVEGVIGAMEFRLTNQEVAEIEGKRNAE